jgi:hypothetical protein
MEPGRSPNFTVLAGALFVAVAAAVLLSAMLVRAPVRGQAAVTVAEPQGAACPAGSGSPACYEVTVTNSGSSAGQVACQVAAAPGTTAEFGNGATAFTTPLDTPFPEGRSLTLTVLTRPIGDKDVAGVPTVTCDIVG